MPSVSVTNLDSFRYWQGDEDLDLDWLLNRLKGGEETEPMRVGKAFHSALEALAKDEDVITWEGYRFDINCDISLPDPTVREIPIQKMYGDLQVRGRIDALTGKEVMDYKVTERFDPDRLLEGYQWRYYLDMAQADKFTWLVFCVRPFGSGDPDKCYEVYDSHILTQYRYPALERDCAELARQYLKFAELHLGVTV